ncbi:MAG: ASCH domain-containing protein [Vulcanimicrobiota bacterium]
MKAITLYQPWATLVALGVKTIETRSWYTGYRGPIAIHAGKSNEHVYLARYHDPFRQALLAADPEKPFDFPLGAVVATATLYDVLATEDVREDPFGDFRPGRFAWMLRDIIRLEPPVAARGHQRLWDWTSEGVERC